MRELVRYGVLLGVICCAASSLLAVANGITEPRIKLQRQRQERQALQEVMLEAVDFKPVMQQDKIVYYVAYGDSQVPLGYVIKSEAKGYASTIEIVSGLGLDLKILRVKILSQNETPGLGSRVADKGFLQQFTGKEVSTFSQIDTLAGATISSAAVIAAVKNKISELAGLLGKEGVSGR